MEINQKKISISVGFELGLTGWKARVLTTQPSELFITKLGTQWAYVMINIYSQPYKQICSMNFCFARFKLSDYFKIFRQLIISLRWFYAKNDRYLRWVFNPEAKSISVRGALVPRCRIMIVQWWWWWMTRGKCICKHWRWVTTSTATTTSTSKLSRQTKRQMFIQNILLTMFG